MGIEPISSNNRLDILPGSYSILSRVIKMIAYPNIGFGIDAGHLLEYFLLSMFMTSQMQWLFLYTVLY
jgi:hypothetical protein